MLADWLHLAQGVCRLATPVSEWPCQTWSESGEAQRNSSRGRSKLAGVDNSSTCWCSMRRRAAKADHAALTLHARMATGSPTSAAANPGALLIATASTPSARRTSLEFPCHMMSAGTTRGGLALSPPAQLSLRVLLRFALKWVGAWQRLKPGGVAVRHAAAQDSALAHAVSRVSVPQRTR